MEALGTFNFSVAPRHHFVLFFWGISHHAAIGEKGALWPLSWEQSNAVWILIKFIKQITQQLGEAGVHLPAPQTDLCRDVDWMVVKTKLPSSADGLLSPVGEIWWRSNNSFPLQVFVPCNCDWRSPSLSFPSLSLPPTHPSPLCLCEQCLNLSDLFEKQVPADLILCMCRKAHAEKN